MNKINKIKMKTRQDKNKKKDEQFDYFGEPKYARNIFGAFIVILVALYRYVKKRFFLKWFHNFCCFICCRTQKEVNGTIQSKYLYDQDNIILDLDSNNQIIAKYIYGPIIDEPLVMIFWVKLMFSRRW